MKLLELASRLDKSEQNASWVNLEELGDQLDVTNVPHVKQNRITCYWVGNWHCTDTYVGYRMYFLDKDPIAFSIQDGRKCAEEFQWFNLDVATKTRDYLRSLLIEHTDELSVDLIDLEEDIGDQYIIEFSGQIIADDNVTLNNEKVAIIERIQNKPYGIDTELKIQLANGEEKHVDIRDLRFGFHVVD